jgi:CRISPR-associated protein Csd1
MILQALKEYYDRKAADPEGDIAPEGFEKKEFPFLIVIDTNGSFVKLEDTREQIGKKLVGKTYLVPRSQLRSGIRSYETTFLLWDHFGYLLQHPETDDKSAKQHEAWLKKLQSLPAELKLDEGVSAVLKFYHSHGIEAVKSTSSWSVCAALTFCNMTFKLVGDLFPVPCRSAVQEYIRQSASIGEEDRDADQNRIIGCCLVTGETAEIVQKHGRTPISKDTKSLVSFQKNSGYDSYRKEQGYNAPVGKAAEFAYTTALNYLLSKDSRQRMQVGDAITVFWSAKTFDSGFEDFFGDLWKDDPDRNTEAVRSLFRSPQSGVFSTDSDDAQFYVLGLSPNAARIAIRFWIVKTVADMATQIRQHFLDIQIVHDPKDTDTISLFRLLVSTAVQRESKNIPPNIAGDTMRSILEGLPYPQTLLQAAIRRVRAEQSRKDKNSGRTLLNVTYERAALIKACINRATRYQDKNKEEELQMSLDPSNKNIGYRLGRLFAALERTQIRAFTSGGGKEPNTTIRDRYYGAASCTPIAVFATLIRLSKHHLAKIENVGERVNLEKLFTEIMEDVNDFPPHLCLADQGRFAIGYYHQRHEFFPNKS